jgi:hypothetical protein
LLLQRCNKVESLYHYIDEKERINLHSAELHNLYSSPDIIRQIKSRIMRWAGHVASMGRGKICRVLVGKPEGKRPLERPRRKWEDGIRMDLREIGWGMEWIHLAQDRDRWRAVVNAVMNLRILAPRSYSVDNKILCHCTDERRFISPYNSLFCKVHIVGSSEGKFSVVSSRIAFILPKVIFRDQQSYGFFASPSESHTFSCCHI